MIDTDNIEYDAEELCPRCNCCSQDWQECDYCCGNGGHFILWYQPGQTGDFKTCDICEGKGGWPVCLGHCDEHGKHKTSIPIN